MDERAPIAGKRRIRNARELPAEEVCELLDVSDGNQRVLLHRARARVRSALVPLVEVNP